jgi:hypothetical protein
MNLPETKTQTITVVPAGMILIRRLYHPVEAETDQEFPIAYSRRNLASLAEEYGQGQPVICLVNDQPVVGGLVMFAAGFDWQCGVIWPDGLHFIHAMPPCDARPAYFEIRQEQLQGEPWRPIIEGYYVLKS